MFPIKDQRAASLVKEFERGWIFRGHGVPKGLLTDQAPNIDGTEVRSLCDRLGIKKRHSSPYHPQADGLVERSIGLVKQVARCLMLGRKLEKDAWPSIITEISFYCNNIENASTGFSAQLLMTGRQPLSPVDAILTEDCMGGLRVPQQHIEELKDTKRELQALARERDGISKERMRERYNMSARSSSIKPGDYVFERNETRADSLDPKFKGPFRVIERRGPNLKIERRRGPKWIHANRCKLYEGVGNSIIVNAGVASQPEENVVVTEEIESMESQQGDETEQDNNDNNEGIETDVSGNEGPDEVGLDAAEQPQRRYPLRARKPKVYEDYVVCVRRPTPGETGESQHKNKFQT